MTIIKNPNIDIYEMTTRAVEDNDGYCPCAIERTDDTKCICKEFRENHNPGECNCGRYIKILSNQNIKTKD